MNQRQAHDKLAADISPYINNPTLKDIAILSDSWLW